MNHDHQITCHDCPYLVKGLDGKPDSHFCTHPQRIWQDICSVDGYPLTDEKGTPYFDFKARCWSECPFLRTITLYRHFLTANGVVIMAHDHSDFAQFDRLSFEHFDTHIPPFHIEGVVFGGPFKGLPYTWIKDANHPS